MVSVTAPASTPAEAGVSGISLPSPIVAATGLEGDDDTRVLRRAEDFARSLLQSRKLDTGEEAWGHAQGVARILESIGAAPSMRAAAYLVYLGDVLHDPEDTIEKAFGKSYAQLVSLTRKLVAVQRAARLATVGGDSAQAQTERVRKMLLSFSKDLRVVLLRLASRLQTLRWFTSQKLECPQALAQESLQVFAPLANRLGIGQIKWELEDLAFRCLQPSRYHEIAKLLDSKRRSRELAVTFFCHQLEGVLRQGDLTAQVYGRPKHIYSIYKKMQGKGLAFEQLMDLRAVRVLAPDVPGCYAALSLIHTRYRALSAEFDDYVAKPKPNGYQSIHTVVLDDEGHSVEVQIRTPQMHEHAENGVAAHWAYKEAGAKGYAGASAQIDSAQRMAQARQAVMRQLLAWEREFAAAPEAPTVAGPSAAAEPIFVLTPQFTVVELAHGATPIDFAYALHTELGHRCRGARVDGALVPLNTRLANGQTVEVVAAKEGGPSLDWLNPDLGFLGTHRARSKVRAWFNAQALDQTVAKGRELVEKLLQREGKTALKLDDLAERLGFRTAQQLFEVVGKDEFSLHQIEALLRPPPAPAPDADDKVVLTRSKASSGGVLVVGVDSLMTSLSKCCRPVPPDDIQGYVTRGKGVAIHRTDCSNFRHMVSQSAGRVIDVAWSEDALARGQGPVAGKSVANSPLFPLDVFVQANDRQGLLRDISDVFARERVNVTGVHTRSVRDATGAHALMTFTVEVRDTQQLQSVLREVLCVNGVRSARRR